MVEAKERGLGCTGCLFIMMAAPFVLMIAFSIIDMGLSYWSWRTLTASELVAEAKAYSVEMSDGRPVCLYAVVCDGRRAQLKLVDDLETFDLEAAKSRIWRRRFESYCEGYTANFAIEAVQTAPADRDEDWFERDRRLRDNRAVWSFYADRFLAVDGHALRAFSENDPEPCTAAKAISPDNGPSSDE